ncbi:MAG TPA: HDOD domain-containing protein [Bryobacteraceae bacterium]|nr:HDOD domain-containing protein [Bryobacteraceae bacterium]
MKFDKSETFAHCHRVAGLARRTGAVMGLSPDVESAIAIAASLHHVCGPDFRAGRLTSFFEDLPELAAAKPADNEVLALAGGILERFLGHGSSPGAIVQTGASILEAANEFDEAVEFGALEGTPAAEAIREFHEESRALSGIGDPRSALCHATAPARFTPAPDHLPILPRAAFRLMHTSDETAPAMLESIVALDPVLAGRLLEAANSARFGPPQPITRLADAASRVGVPLARRILLAACFGEVFASASLRVVWLNSQRIAERASALARRAKLDPGEAWVAGLLHDVGRIVFERAGADSRIRLAGWIESGFPLTYAEALTWSKDHTGTGAELLGAWELPDSIIEAVRHHHHPERSRSPMASLLYLAEQWHAETFGPESAFELFHDMRSHCASERTGISAADLRRVDVSSHAMAAG